MTTYLLPVYDPNNGVYVNKCRARNWKEAHEKFISDFAEEFEDMAYPSDWADLIKELDKLGIIVGDIYDIDEF